MRCRRSVCDSCATTSAHSKTRSRGASSTNSIARISPHSRVGPRQVAWFRNGLPDLSRNRLPADAHQVMLEQVRSPVPRRSADRPGCGCRPRAAERVCVLAGAAMHLQQDAAAMTVPAAGADCLLRDDGSPTLALSHLTTHERHPKGPASRGAATATGTPPREGGHLGQRPVAGVPNRWISCALTGRSLLRRRNLLSIGQSVALPTGTLGSIADLLRQARSAD